MSSKLTESRVKCYELLQSATPKDFIDVSFVRVVHQTVASAFPECIRVPRKGTAVTSPSGGAQRDDTDRLHDIFAACIQIGLTSVIAHFIDEISNDADCVSADAVEARLRDGENVFRCMTELMREAKEEMTKVLKKEKKNENEEEEEEERLAHSMVTFQAARRAFEALGAENVDGKERRSNASNAMMIEKLNESRDEAIDLANKAEAALWAC